MSRLLIYGIIALAVLAAITATIAGIYHSGETAGENTIQTRWDAQNAKAQTAADARRQDRERLAQQASTALQQSRMEADDYAQKWREARRAARSVPLAVCGPPSTPPSPSAVTATVASGGVTLRLTYQFLRDYDTAWTGADGKPVFPDPGRPSDAGLEAASPVTLDDALDNHAENAVRCSKNAAQLDKLTALLRQFQAR